MENQPLPDSIEDNSLGNPFLQAVDENDRPIVEKYIKDWDSNVSKKLGEIHEQYKPWKDLGAEPEVVKAALQVMEMANADPYAFYVSVKEQLEELGLMPEENGNPPVGGNDLGGLPEYEGLPEQFVGKFKGMEDTLGKISKFVEDFQSERQRETNQQLLDKTLKELENKHGKFDEDAVLGRIISKGMSPEDAVKDYQNFLKSLNTGPERRTPPPTMGGGRTAVEQVDQTKIKDPKSRRQLVAELLADQ